MAKRRGVWIVATALGLAGCASHPVSEAYRQASDEAFARKAPLFESCYRKFGRHQPLGVVLKFQTTYTGEVAFVEIEPGAPYLSNDAFDGCALEAFKTVKFPETEGASHGTYGRKALKFGM